MSIAALRGQNGNGQTGPEGDPTLRQRRLLSTLGDLLLSLLNATLILVLLCLLAGVKLVSSVNTLTAGIADNVSRLAPLREDVTAMTGEISALRADLAGLGDATGDIRKQGIQSINERLDTVAARMNAYADQVDDLVSDPGQLVDQAVGSAADQLKQGIADLRGCRLPEF
jgi:hypothetical protein